MSIGARQGEALILCGFVAVRSGPRPHISDPLQPGIPRISASKRNCVSRILAYRACRESALASTAPTTGTHMALPAKVRKSSSEKVSNVVAGKPEMS